MPKCKSSPRATAVALPTQLKIPKSSNAELNTFHNFVSSHSPLSVLRKSGDVLEFKEPALQKFREVMSIPEPYKNERFFSPETCMDMQKSSSRIPFTLYNRINEVFKRDSNVLYTLVPQNQSETEIMRRFSFFILKEGEVALCSSTIKSHSDHIKNVWDLSYLWHLVYSVSWHSIALGKWFSQAEQYFKLGRIFIGMDAGDLEPWSSIRTCPKFITYTEIISCLIVRGRIISIHALMTSVYKEIDLAISKLDGFPRMVELSSLATLKIKSDKSNSFIVTEKDLHLESWIFLHKGRLPFMEAVLCLCWYFERRVFHKIYNECWNWLPAPSRIRIEHGIRSVGCIKLDVPWSRLSSAPIACQQNLSLLHHKLKVPQLLPLLQKTLIRIRFPWHLLLRLNPKSYLFPLLACNLRLLLCPSPRI